MVMPVDFAHRPAKREQLVHQRFQAKCLADRGQALQLVVVNYRHEVVERWWAANIKRLPVRALVHLAVAEQHEHAPCVAAPLCRQRLANAERQSMPQGAAGEFNTGNLVADVVM